MIPHLRNLNCAKSTPVENDHYKMAWLILCASDFQINYDNHARHYYQIAYDLSNPKPNKFLIAAAKSQDDLVIANHVYILDEIPPKVIANLTKNSRTIS